MPYLLPCTVWEGSHSTEGQWCQCNWWVAVQGGWTGGQARGYPGGREATMQGDCPPERAASASFKSPGKIALLWPLLCVSYLSTFSCAQQDTATQEQSLSRSRESELEEKIKVLEEIRSDLEAEVERLEKQMKQLEILPSDIEQLTKVHIDVYDLLFVRSCPMERHM